MTAANAASQLLEIFEACDVRHAAPGSLHQLLGGVVEATGGIQAVEHLEAVQCLLEGAVAAEIGSLPQLGHGRLIAVVVILLQDFL